MLRTITRLIRTSLHSNSGHRHNKPLHIYALRGCVHEACNFGDDPLPIGSDVSCDLCGDVNAALNRIRAFVPTDDYSHVTIRSLAADRCRAWESYFFYRRDVTSPTQCRLEFSAPACDEVAALVDELGKRAVPGPSRGAMAMC